MTGYFRDTIARVRYLSAKYDLPFSMIPFCVLEDSYKKFREIGLHNHNVLGGDTGIGETIITDISKELQFSLFRTISAENPPDQGRIFFVNGGTGSILYSFLDTYPDYEAYVVFTRNCPRSVRTRTLLKMTRHRKTSVHSLFCFEENQVQVLDGDVVVDFYPSFLSPHLYESVNHSYIFSMELSEQYHTGVQKIYCNFHLAKEFLLGSAKDGNLLNRKGDVLFRDKEKHIQRATFVVHDVFVDPNDISGKVDVFQDNSNCSVQQLDIPTMLPAHVNKGSGKEFFMWRIVRDAVCEVPLTLDHPMLAPKMISNSLFGVATSLRRVASFDIVKYFPHVTSVIQADVIVAYHNCMYFLADVCIPTPRFDRLKLLHHYGCSVLPLSSVPICDGNYVFCRNQFEPPFSHNWGPEASVSGILQSGRRPQIHAESTSIFCDTIYSGVITIGFNGSDLVSCDPFVPIIAASAEFMEFSASLSTYEKVAFSHGYEIQKVGKLFLVGGILVVPYVVSGTPLQGNERQILLDIIGPPSGYDCVDRAGRIYSSGVSNGAISINSIPKQVLVDLGIAPLQFENRARVMHEISGVIYQSPSVSDKYLSTVGEILLNPRFLY
jgi:hypothetical protein